MAAKEYMTMSAQIKCSNGAAPVPIVMGVGHGVVSCKTHLPVLNANDHIPMVNIMPFGTCKVKPPAPPGANVCIPVTPMPWSKGDKNYSLDGMPALTKDSCLTCMLGGTIKFQ